MFLVRCLLGHYTKGSSSYTRPPPKQPEHANGDLYDSCVNDESKPTIYVIFDSDQYYPEYAITYKLQDGEPFPRR